MIIEAVRRIIAPAAAVFIRMLAAVRAARAAAGILMIAAALKKELAGRTINSESLWGRKPLRRRPLSKTEKSIVTMKNAV